MTGLLALSTVVLLGATATAVGRTWRVLHPPRVRGAAGRSPRPAEFHALTADGSRLAGWLLETPEPLGLVVFCHNLGSHKGRLLPIARELGRAGLSVALFDFRGHGESDRHRGWSKLFRRYAEDLSAVLSALRRREVASGNGIILAGYSLGTVAALLAGAEDPEVRGFVLDSGPALSVTRVFRRRFRAAFRLPPIPFQWLALPLLAFWVGERRLAVDLRAALGRLGGRPLLVVHGDRDEIVTREDADEVFSLAATGRKELWAVPGAHHMTAFAVDREAYVRRLLGFVEAALAPDRARRSADG